MKREAELWAMALWVERHHGEQGTAFIAAQIERNASAGEQGGVDLWQAVQLRLDRLPGVSPAKGH